MPIKPALPSSQGVFTKSMSLLGTVTEIDAENGSLRLRCRSGEEFLVQIGTETSFSVLRNMDDLDRDRIPNPPGFDPSKGVPEKSANTSPKATCWWSPGS